jgi:hypothetical protein
MEALLIVLPEKLEGQPRTYRHRKLTFTCPAGPCPAETSAASAQLKYTSRRIGTETRPIRNTPTPREVHPSIIPRASRFTSSYTLFSGFVRQSAAISDVRIYSVLIVPSSSSSLT